MKKTTLLLAVVLALLNSMAYASCEIIPQWEEGCNFLYGMQVTDIAGEFLPSAPIDVSYLYNGIKVSIMNGMPYNDECMLIFLLNGYVQPFYIGKQQYDYYQFDIAANSSVEIDIYFDLLYIVDACTQYIHIISIGLLNIVPINSSDIIDFYTNTITIPFFSNNPANTLPLIDYGQYVLSEKLVKERGENSCQIDFYSSIEYEKVTLMDTFKYFSAVE